MLFYYVCVCALMPAYSITQFNKIVVTMLAFSLTATSVALCNHTIILALFSLFLSISLFIYLSRCHSHLSWHPKILSVSLHSIACNHSNKVISSVFFYFSVHRIKIKKNTKNYFFGILKPSGYTMSIVFCDFC